MEDGTMESKAFEGCLSREVALWQSQVRSFELPFVLRQRRKIRDVEMQRLIEEKSYMLQCLLHDATPKDILEMNKKFSSLALEIRFDPVATDRRRCHGDAEFLLRYPLPNKTTVPRRLKKGLAPSIYRHALRSVQEQDPRPQDLVSIPLPEALLADIERFVRRTSKAEKSADLSWGIQSSNTAARILLMGTKAESEVPVLTFRTVRMANHQKNMDNAPVA
jgi:hypothetical protein